MSVEQQVEEAVASLFASIAARDLDGAVAHYAPLDDIICLGPAADDVSVGVQGVYNTLSRQMSQSHEIQCQYLHASSGVKGDVAWTIGQSSMVFVTSQGSFALQGRYTSVLEFDQDKNRWLIRHSLFSVPTADQGLAALFPSDLASPQAPPPTPAVPAGDPSAPLTPPPIPPGQ